MRKGRNLQKLLGQASFGILRLASNVADGETITIGREVYEIDTAADPGAITAGRIRVNCSSGVTPTIASAELVKAIHANTQQNLRAEAISVNEVLVVCMDGILLATTETLAGANNAWNAATLEHGISSDVLKGHAIMSRAATAQDVALTAVRFFVPFVAKAVIVQVRTAANVQDTNPDGAVTITNALGGSRINVAVGTTIAAGDVVTIFASE